MRRALRLILVVWMVCCGRAAHAQPASLLQTPYTPAFTTGTLEAFIQDIRKQTDVAVSYSSSVVSPQRRATLSGTERTIGAALEKLFEGEGVQLVARRTKILVVAAARARPAPLPMHTVSGFVRDSNTREVLIGAAITVPALGRGISTNFYGFYSLTLPEGRHTVITSYTGSKPDTAVLDIRGDVQRSVLLSAQTVMQEVAVKDTRRLPADRLRLSPRDILRKAAPIGEADVMRALQRTPGVQAQTDGTSTLLVRGGEPGQNLHLLDGVPLYYTDHFFGVTSVFNTDALKTVDFYKGGFPARYGGRLSSIVDVAARDGNMERWSGNASLGLLRGSMLLEGPVVKEKASVMVSARRTWLDLLWRPFTDRARLNFYDVNAKANWIVNKNHRFYLSGYTGRDRAGLDFGRADDASANDAADFRHGNTTVSGKWTAVINPKLFVSTSATWGRFRQEVSNNLFAFSGDTAHSGDMYTGRSLLRDAALQTQAFWYPSSRHRVEAGARYSSLQFEPSSLVYYNADAQEIGRAQAPSFQTGEVMLHAEDAISLPGGWTLRPGLHWTTWIGKDYRYTSPQLRMYASYAPSKTHLLYASAAQMTQFLHSVPTSSGGATPFNVWLPSTDNLAPEESLTGALGWAAQPGKKLSWSLEGYYKHMKNILDYRNPTSSFYASTQWERALTSGTGWSYGGEASLQSRFGPLEVSAAYTISWTFRRFDAINNGAVYPAQYDRRHNIKTDLFYQKRKRFNAAFAWTFLSGEAFSLPDQMAPDFDSNLPIAPGDKSPQTIALHYTARNNYRLPPIHRLDFALNFVKPIRKHGERTWTLGLYNAYGRPNVTFAELVPNSAGGYSLQTPNGFSLRLLPTIAYRRSF